jgi:hypothetical protein
MKDSLSIDEIVDGLYKLQQEKNDRIFLHAVKEALQSQADQYEREKGEMVSWVKQRRQETEFMQDSDILDDFIQKYG